MAVARNFDEARFCQGFCDRRTFFGESDVVHGLSVEVCMDVVKYCIIVSLYELVSLETNDYMGLKGALQIRQGDGLSGKGLSGLDLLDIHDHILDFSILDQIRFRG